MGEEGNKLIKLNVVVEKALFSVRLSQPGN
jgi:hypothetical protein